MKNLILLFLVLGTAFTGVQWLGSRDSCTNPDFASYGSTTTCKTH